MPLRHVVLFRMYEECTDEAVDDVVERLQMLGDLPGILSWRVEKSLDERKGRVIIEDATFATQQDLDAFRHADRHAGVAQRMSTMADWLIGNYWCADDEVPRT